MAVRKTEQRLPNGFSPADFGQHVASADGKKILISYNSSPIVRDRIQQYIVFVTDPAIAAQVTGYEWTVPEAGIPVQKTTTVGSFAYKPDTEGNIKVKVELKNGAAVIDTLQLDQLITGLNSALEVIYAQTEKAAPLASDPLASREVINDLRIYMDQLAPRTADPKASLNHFLFVVAYIEVMGQMAEQRNPALEKIATAFDAGNTTMFADEGIAGIGVCRIRPHVLGMYLPKTAGGNDFYITAQEYPAVEADRAAFERTLIDEVKKLTRDQLIDLFNLLRFPKSNLKMTLQLLEGLRKQYFGADSTEVIIANKTKAQSFLDQFKQGPYKKV